MPLARRSDGAAARGVSAFFDRFLGASCLPAWHRSGDTLDTARMRPAKKPGRISLVAAT